MTGAGTFRRVLGGTTSTSSGLPLCFFTNGGSRQARTLRHESVGQNLTGQSAKPTRLAQLVLHAGVLEAGRASCGDRECRLSTVRLGLGFKPLAGSESAHEVPEGTVAPTLLGVGIFVRSGTSEQRTR